MCQLDVCAFTINGKALSFAVTGPQRSACQMWLGLNSPSHSSLTFVERSTRLSTTTTITTTWHQDSHNPSDVVPSTMSDQSSTPSLTPSRSTSPTPTIVQPDHFYGFDDAHHSPNVHGKTYLDPNDDPLAQRGIPVFKPTIEEFRDFEGYMNSVEPWGVRSGIVKVIPPTEW